MPELPDLTIYVDALTRHAAGQRLERVRMPSFTLMRTYDPPVSVLEGKRLDLVRLVGKHLVFAFEGDLRFVLHLMVAGRLQWKPRGAPVPGRIGHFAWDFPGGTLVLTEAGSRKRAHASLVRGDAAADAFSRGGVDPLAASDAELAAALCRENRTVKRALTDPSVVAGVGNAYSDEILHRARLSPLVWTSRLDEGEVERLVAATRDVLTEWIARLRAEAAGGFPGKVTAFRPEMAVHGRYGSPCPDCGSPVQRIVRAENEVNYCATCQTGGKVYADRALSQLLKDDWPRTVEEWEELPGAGEGRKDAPRRARRRS